MDSSGESVERRSIGQKILARIIMWSEKRVPAHSLVGTGPLIKHEEFPWAETLERGWPEIRGELD